MKSILKLVTVVFSLLLVLQSCTKDKGFEKNEYGINMVNKGTVGFARGTSDTTPVVYPLPIATTTYTDNAVLLVLENTEALSGDVVVTISRNPGLLTKVPGLAAVPATAFTIPATITVKGGTNLVILPITYANSSLLTVGNFYGIGLTITTVNSAGVSIDRKNLLMEVTLKNQYDGVYKANGYFYHPSSPRAILNKIVDVTTVGANVCETNLGDLGNLMRLTIDGSNNVTISDVAGPVGGSPTINYLALPAVYTPFAGSTPSIYTNKYDPATKTFYLRYGYTSASGIRLVEEILERQ